MQNEVSQFCGYGNTGGNLIVEFSINKCGSIPSPCNKTVTASGFSSIDKTRII